MPTNAWIEGYTNILQKLGQGDSPPKRIEFTNPRDRQWWEGRSSHKPKRSTTSAYGPFRTGYKFAPRQPSQNAPIKPTVAQSRPVQPPPDTSGNFFRNRLNAAKQFWEKADLTGGRYLGQGAAEAYARLTIPTYEGSTQQNEGREQLGLAPIIPGESPLTAGSRQIRRIAGLDAIRFNK